jgi:hypothetical protein
LSRLVGFFALEDAEKSETREMADASAPWASAPSRCVCLLSNSPVITTVHALEAAQASHPPFPLSALSASSRAKKPPAGCHCNQQFRFSSLAAIGPRSMPLSPQPSDRF